MEMVFRGRPTSIPHNVWYSFKRPCIHSFCIICGPELNTTPPPKLITVRHDSNLVENCASASHLRFNAVHDFQAFDSKLFGLHGFYGSLNVAPW